MNAQKIKDRIAECCTLFAFTYNGKDGDVDPFNKNLFTLTYNGESTDVFSLDAVMSTPYFDGKSLNDIAGEITITEW